MWWHSTPQLSPLNTNYCRTTVAQWLAPQSTNVSELGFESRRPDFSEVVRLLLRHLNKKIPQQPPSKREERHLQPAAYNYHGYMKEEDMRRDEEDGEKKKKKCFVQSLLVDSSVRPSRLLP